MKKTALFIGLVGSAVLLAGCTKAKVATQEVVSSQMAQVESEVTGIVEEAVSEQLSEVTEQLSEVTEQTGTITPAVDSAVAEFATLIDSFDEGAYIGFADLNGTTVLLQGIETFEDDFGNVLADNATCFVIKDGEATMCGELMGGGTAYAIAVKDGALYTGNRTGIIKATLNDDMTLVEEESDEDTFAEAAVIGFSHKEDLLQ